MSKLGRIAAFILKGLGLYRTHAEYDSWLDSLKLRHEEERKRQWSTYQIPDVLFENLARILSLPNAYLYPSDKLDLVLFNRFADLSDVEAILYLEDELGISIKMDDDLKRLTLGNLFPLDQSLHPDDEQGDAPDAEDSAKEELTEGDTFGEQG